MEVRSKERTPIAEGGRTFYDNEADHKEYVCTEYTTGCTMKGKTSVSFECVNTVGD